MLDVFNFPTPQQSNYQEFLGGGTSTTRTWVKPRGVSMVRIMLIGGGGGGGNGTGAQGGGGGGSGTVTSWIGPAMFIPDILRITVGQGGTSGVDATASRINYQAKNTIGYFLLDANGGTSGTTATSNGSGGSAMPANAFCASGIFNTVAGQNGENGSATGAGVNISASSTTFLQGGAGGAGATGAGSTGGSVTPNYGYTPLSTTAGGGLTAAKNGYFITQPILVGCGGAGGSTSTTVGTGGGRGGIGCGGGGSGEDAGSGGRGGDGAVYIWAW